jgi:DNA-binding transcriptional ArsR family regulator
MRAALHLRPNVTPSARAVWLILAIHTNGDGDCWPALDVLADLAGMSERSVRRSLRALEDVGLLETTRLENRRNLYRVVVSDAPSFRFSTTGHQRPDPTGHQRPDVRTSRSGHTGQISRKSAGQSPAEVHNEVQKEGARNSSHPSNGAAQPPRKGVGAVPAPITTDDGLVTFLPGSGWIKANNQQREEPDNPPPPEPDIELNLAAIRASRDAIRNGHRETRESDQP